ncbi:MAG: tRNA-dihydrouridine synthase [Patescibacteria group bacterium]
MIDFWTTLSKPFFALAPMEDVTDAAFRQLIARYRKPDVMFTEFTSADGLVLADEKGRKKLRQKLLYSESERPIVAQIFSSVPENIEKASKLVAELGFDGVDINMGCPDRAVEKSGCGAALIKNSALARDLIRAAKKSGLPVSLKTRIGYNEDELDFWLPELLFENPAAITIHARTRKEMSDVPARWERIKHAVEIRDSLGSKTFIIGNGDVKDIEGARAKAHETLCDGVMLGRAIFGNPWLFADVGHLYIPTPEEKIRALLEHLALFEELLADTANYAAMKKHFKAYISGWSAGPACPACPACAGMAGMAGIPGAKELRARLMDTNSLEMARDILECYTRS